MNRRLRAGSRDADRIYIWAGHRLRGVGRVRIDWAQDRSDPGRRRGTPAVFLHPADSAHGDLGIVGAEDIAILISKSGESEELLSLLDNLKRFGVRTIAITANPASMLGTNVDIVLDAWVREEACPHDLAPTTSTTVALAVGDALAVALLEEKGFAASDFARLHPGGTLGRKDAHQRVGDVNGRP